MKHYKLVLAGLFIGLTIVLQLLLSPFAQPAVGPMVNMMLALSGLLLGPVYGIVVGLITPIVAALVGLLPFISLAPIVMIGNAMLLVFFFVIKKRDLASNAISLGLGSLLKFVVLANLIRYVGPLILGNVPDKLLLAFTWPQLFNALLGSFVALVVYKYIPKKYKFIEKVKL